MAEGQLRPTSYRCEGCGATGDVGQRGPVPTKCAPCAAAARDRKRWQAKRHVEQRSCIECGASFATARAWQLCCGPQCAKVYDGRRDRSTPAGRARRRAAWTRRRALKTTATAERFDPVDVLRRDGWRCHLCGCEAPEALRGTFEPNAPELDHIIPLSKGGEHTRRNTACACRRCNLAKRDSVPGEKAA